MTLLVLKVNCKSILKFRQYMILALNEDVASLFLLCLPMAKSLVQRLAELTGDLQIQLRR